MKEDVIGNEAYAHYGFDICFDIVATEEDEEKSVEILDRKLKFAIAEWLEQVHGGLPNVKIGRLEINEEPLE